MATAYPPWPTICVRAAIFTNMCLIKGCLRAVSGDIARHFRVSIKQCNLGAFRAQLCQGQAVRACAPLCHAPPRSLGQTLKEKKWSLECLLKTHSRVLLVPRVSA